MSKKSANQRQALAVDWSRRGLSRLSKSFARYKLLTQKLINKKSLALVEDFIVGKRYKSTGLKTNPH
jgi:hypothetical protein